MLLEEIHISYDYAFTFFSRCTGFVKEHGPFKVVFKGPEDESGEIQQDFKLLDNEFRWVEDCE